MQSGISYKPDTSSGTTYTTTYALNGIGVASSASVVDGRPRTVTFTTDLLGQVVRRDEADGVAYNATTGLGGDPHDVWYRFDGREMGHVGNNGTLDTDYQSSIDARGMTQGTGAFRFGLPTAWSATEMAPSLERINSFNQGSAGGSYTVQAGDTISTSAVSQVAAGGPERRARAPTPRKGARACGAWRRTRPGESPDGLEFTDLSTRGKLEQRPIRNRTKQE